MEGKAIYAALLAVQRDLKAPKGQRNTFGKYNYRSAEDILEAVKPLLNDNGLVLLLSDSIEQVGERYYVKATARVLDVATGDYIENAAYAREPVTKKGMDDPQVTGTCSSYARKYALNGLFAIDDTKDADTDEYRRETSSRAAGARSGGNAGNYTNHGGNGVQTGAQAQETANDGYDRRVLLHKVTAEIERTGTNSAEVAAIAKAKYGKSSTRDMNEIELKDLAENLESYLAERAAG
ncbi:MAG: ERF family protein [Veillonellaceae bacterium]|nr:ERF family protein [Veillonellaceae bacterium]MDD6697935.1 ERF family protein [Veillonellaceae bacterium]